MSNIVKNYSYKLNERCIRCGKKLRTTNSKILGYGPSCYKKYLKEKFKNKNRRLF